MMSKDKVKINKLETDINTLALKLSKTKEKHKKELKKVQEQAITAGANAKLMIEHAAGQHNKINSEKMNLNDELKTMTGRHNAMKHSREKCEQAAFIFAVLAIIAVLLRCLRV